MTADAPPAWGDEMRVGLCGCVRRMWAPRGLKIRQRVQMRREWRYLALAVAPDRGTLTWPWIANMKGPQIATAAAHWRDAGVAAVVWDGASGHRAPEVQQPFSSRGVRGCGSTFLYQPRGPLLPPRECPILSDCRCRNRPRHDIGGHMLVAPGYCWRIFYGNLERGRPGIRTGRQPGPRGRQTHLGRHRGIRRQYLRMPKSRTNTHNPSANDMTGMCTPNLWRGLAATVMFAQPEQAQGDRRGCRSGPSDRA